jgi:ubiquinone/menaquinone biosynthesis C-methylase UbiE
MQVMADPNTKTVDYDHHAGAYAGHRRVHPGVVEALIADGPITATTRILDVGCGTGSYAAVLSARTGCRFSGVEPSERMRDRARDAASWDSLAEGTAERLPFASGQFDLVMSTDVIHHVGHRDAFFREAMRVLVPGGRVVTVTDSHDDIPRRRPLSSHFPETVPIELDRYPATSQLVAEMSGAGFQDIRLSQVSNEYELNDIQPYRNKAFSSLLLLDDEAFARGLRQLEDGLAQGPIPCISLYTMIWGSKPLT